MYFYTVLFLLGIFSKGVNLSICGGIWYKMLMAKPFWGKL